MRSLLLALLLSAAAAQHLHRPLAEGAGVPLLSAGADVAPLGAADAPLLGAGAGAPPQTRLLAYGDSLTAGFYARGSLFAPYAAQLSRRLGGCVVDHIGLSGFTADQMRASLGSNSSHLDGTSRSWAALDAALDGAAPPYTAVVILAGTNDLGRLRHAGGPRTAESVVGDIVALHRAALATGARTVALTVPQPAFEAGRPQLAEGRAAINAGLVAFAATNSNVTLVDVAAALPNLQATDGAGNAHAPCRCISLTIFPCSGAQRSEPYGGTTACTLRPRATTRWRT
jgi:lysophospholipase L1-like esterase